MGWEGDHKFVVHVIEPPTMNVQEDARRGNLHVLEMENTHHMQVSL